MQLYKWFSVCSKHQTYREDCECCTCGRWIFIPIWWIGHIFYKLFPSVWILWANRPVFKIKWKNKFRDRRTGKKSNPFPNLK